MTVQQRFAQEGPLRVEGGAFVDGRGARFTFRGVSWFGFDGRYGFLDGLNKAYNGRGLDSALVRDWKVVAARIKLLGFNTIRLPFAWSYVLPRPGIRALDGSADELVDKPVVLVSEDDLRKNLTNPAHTPAPDAWGAEAKALAREVLPQSNNAGIKRAARHGDGAPQDVLERFLDTVRELVGLGFFVVLDNQLQQDAEAQVLLTQQGAWGAEQWVRNWVDLMRRVYALPDIKGARVRDYVIVDVLNEPDYSWLKWEPSGPPWNLPGVRDLYKAAIRAIHDLQPDGDKATLFFVEGCGDRSYNSGKSVNWGDYFEQHNPQVTGFLDDVLHESYYDKVIISPHVYPPSVSKLGDPDAWLGPGPIRYTPEGVVTRDTPRAGPDPRDLKPGSGPRAEPALFERLDNLLGYLTRKFVGSNGVEHRFPVCVGESGSAFLHWPLPEPDMGNTAAGPWATKGGPNNFAFFPKFDPIYMKALAWYFQDRNITNFIWWTWNANGGDTGGLTTPEQDMWQPNQDPNNPDHIVLPRDPPGGIPWTDVTWDKVDWLQTNMGLAPWYSRDPGAAKTPMLSGVQNGSQRTATS